MVDTGDFLEPGARIESSGQFTVDWKVGASRLARLLPDPSHLVLKIIQAFVASGCSEVEVEVNVHKHYLSLGGKGGVIDPDELKGQLNRGRLRGSGNEPAVILAFGLTAAWAAGLDPGLALVRNGEVESVIESACAPPALEGTGIYFWLEAPWIGSVKPLIDERCLYCPVKVFFRRGSPFRNLERPDEALSGVMGAWPSGMRLVESFARDFGPDRVGVKSTGEVHPVEKQLWTTALHPILLRQGFEVELPGGLRVPPAPTDPPKNGLVAAACIPEELRGPSWLVLVKQGVALRPVRVLDDFGCVFVCDGVCPVDFSTDLSTLVAVNGRELDQRIREVQAHLAQLLSYLEPKLEPPLQLSTTQVGDYFAQRYQGILAELATLGIAWPFYHTRSVGGGRRPHHKTTGEIRARIRSLREALGVAAGVADSGLTPVATFGWRDSANSGVSGPST